ncbi:e05496ef-16f7-430b-812f-4ff3883312c8-CDS [Sclerotinia trifoliorum]|uniref:E05496ef-16f7-430b-812f-4ff3883312c8-CDS n=1 Tax=Sclerotinia trifoliorum TaxID=28548 RepID=A0A8H2VX16_9HELO|nr:e05496ef-16f7-430b-812f-4ff3883312c8-CDS [Sclerotinia trifoliorum]
MDSLSSVNGSRPYRSHKIPAYDRCRKRKLRCEADLSNGPYRICQDQDVDCTRIPGSSPLASPRLRNNSRHSIEESVAEQCDPQSPEYSQQERTIVNAKSSMIISPVIAEDIQVLEQYMES